MFKSTPPRSSINTSHPNGHFYSPVVDPKVVLEQQDRIWPEKPTVLGIDFNAAHHRQVLEECFPRHLAAYDYPEHAGASPTEFYTQNSQFSWLDSRTLFVLLNEWKPRRMIEVGSGFSSLLSADINRRFLDSSMEFSCIEPYPRDFLRQPIPGLSAVLEKKVEEVPLDYFAQLQRGDILFIDSSHVSKTGSDVNYLFFEVLPRLKPGVRIHVHDIFLPHDYPKEWVLGDNRSWNEQYLLRALLMYSSGFRVLFGCKYAETHHAEALQRALNLPDGRIFGGGSFWFEKLV
jgi:hypothetical protein